MRIFGKKPRTGLRPAVPVENGTLESKFPDFDETARQIIAKCKPHTMTSPERLFSVIESVRYLTQHRIEGALVECGVWRGGSMMAAAETLISLGCTDRDLYLLDTYSGMPPAGSDDRDFTGDHATDLMREQDRESSVVWAVAQIDEVKTNMASTNYPNNRIHYIKGKVEDTIPNSTPDQIAMLRLDTDWYESTRHELIHLYPNLTAGGVLIIDDYGHWQGARRAVDEYVQQQNLSILLNRIDYTGRIAVKPFRSAA